jgi:tRNA(fMet)-specific endonuclease VapC
MFVLDTNTLVYFFRGEGGVAQRLLSTAPAEIAIPAVVVFELETGIQKSTDSKKRRGQLDVLLQATTVLSFGLAEARAAASIRATLEQAGTPIGPMDTLIAATAVAHRATLVTRNTREFSRVPGLTVVDWYGPAT